MPIANYWQGAFTLSHTVQIIKFCYFLSPKTDKHASASGDFVFQTRYRGFDPGPHCRDSRPPAR